MLVDLWLFTLQVTRVSDVITFNPFSLYQKHKSHVLHFVTSFIMLMRFKPHRHSMVIHVANFQIFRRERPNVPLRALHAHFGYNKPAGSQTSLFPSGYQTHAV